MGAKGPERPITSGWTALKEQEVLQNSPYRGQRELWVVEEDS
jgi:hypothetical protein